MANLMRHDPFGVVLDDLFKGFLVRPVGYRSNQETGAQMVVDVTEQANAYQVHAELPGVKKENIHVSIDGAQVTLSAEVQREHTAQEGQRVLHAERVYGKSTRRFTLPQEIDEATAQARYIDGVLELTLPKKVPVASKRLTIQ